MPAVYATSPYLFLLVTDGEMTGGFISDAEPVIGRRYAPTRWRIPE